MMSSSLAASTLASATLVAIDNKTETTTKIKNNSESNDTENVLSPITDKKKTSACSSTNNFAQFTLLTVGNTHCVSNCSPNIVTSTSTPTKTNLPTKATSKTTATTTTTRIPHPLVSVLASKTNQFQRSASLRLRNLKSRLPGGNIYNDVTVSIEGGDKMATKHVNNTAETTLNASVKVNGVDVKRKQAQTTPPRTYAEQELTATGQLSPRRKLVLNSQNNLGSGLLTRSLSLRKNYKYSNFKTAATSQKTNGVAGATEATREAPDGQVNDNGDSTIPATTITTMTTNNILAQIDEEIGTASEFEKMSLNLNGDGNSNSNSTSTSTSAPRPATLNTESGNTFASKLSAGTPKTPRTPVSGIPVTNTQYTTSHTHTHAAGKCTYTQATKQVSPLPSVPETKLTPKTPPVTPDSPSTYLDDDLDSMYSFATTTSGRSTMSCEHPYVARNGTTFSGRKMKYVVHCSNYAGQVGPDYLTPTQRAARQVRRLKELLCAARHDLEQKDSEILRLTREVVELRLFKASLSSPEERSASSDAVTVREAELKTSQDVSPIVDMVDDVSKSSPRHIAHVGGAHHLHLQHRHSSSPQNVMQLSSEMQNSFADSGHFEDMTSSSVHSKDSYGVHTQDIACGSDDVASGSGSGDSNSLESYELQRQELIRLYEQRIEELIHNQDAISSEMKRNHNDKVEALLQKLAECNTRYADIVPDYEHAKERIRELEKQLEDLQHKLAEHEEKQNKMYLHMYQKGQEAERIARADQALELAHRAPNSKVSINELLHQLQNTQDELENIRAAECRNECGSNHALLTAKEAISLWVLGARKTIYRRLLEAQKNRTHVDPEVTLQFLKSAVYYFLTDKENSQGHLQAIESILEFTETEKLNINRARTNK